MNLKKFLLEFLKVIIVKLFKKTLKLKYLVFNLKPKSVNVPLNALKILNWSVMPLDISSMTISEF